MEILTLACFLKPLALDEDDYYRFFFQDINGCLSLVGFPPEIDPEAMICVSS
jgi:hypothetical protein